MLEATRIGNIRVPLTNTTELVDIRELSAIVSRDSRAISTANFACRRLVGWVIVFAPIAIVIGTIVIVSSAADSVVLWFNHGEVHRDDDCHDDQRDCGNGKDPDEGPLVKGLGPRGLEIGCVRDVLLASLRK